MTNRTKVAASAAGLVLLTAQALASAAGAQAATGTVVDRNFDVYTVFAQDGKANDIQISTANTANGVKIAVEDAGDLVIPGDDCIAVTTHRVECAQSLNPELIISGGDLNDTLTNVTSIPATMQGGTGNDRITAGNAVGGSQNILSGDAGTDTLIGGTNGDKVLGGAGTDTLDGGSGNDTMDGGPGNDTMTGGPGNDSYRSSDTEADGADVMAGDGSDIVSYASRTGVVGLSLDGLANDGAAGEGDNITGAFSLTGGSAADTLTGDANFNVLNGGPGNDTLDGGAGSDSLSGNQGNDTLSAGPGLTVGAGGVVPDGDTLGGNEGIDTVEYSTRTVPLIVTINGQANDGAASEGDNVRVDVENVIGGTVDDSITGSAEANTLNGGKGKDTLIGGAGNDALNGQVGNDTLNSVDGVATNDKLNGGNDIDDCTSDPGDPEAECES